MKRTTTTKLLKILLSEFVLFSHYFLCCMIFFHLPANFTKPVIMPAVTFWLRCGWTSKSSEIHGIHCDRMLTCRKHEERTALKFKKCQSVLKAMAAKGIEQRHLFLLYQSVMSSVTDYRLGLTTMAQTNLLKLTECRTRQCESHWEPQRTPPLRPWSLCYTCHQ